MGREYEMQKWKTEDLTKTCHMVIRLPVSNSHTMHWLAQPEQSESNGKIAVQTKQQNLKQ